MGVYQETEAVQAVRSITSVYLNRANRFFDIMRFIAPCVIWNSLTEIRCSLIQRVKLNEFYFSHKTTEASKNISCAKGKDAVEYSDISR